MKYFSTDNQAMEYTHHNNTLHSTLIRFTNSIDANKKLKFYTKQTNKWIHEKWNEIPVNESTHLEFYELKCETCKKYRTWIFRANDFLVIFNGNSVYHWISLGVLLYIC